MSRLALLLIVLHIVPLFASEIKGTWYKLPPGSLQMEPAIFLSPALYAHLLHDENIQEGDPVVVKKQNRSMHARIYRSLRTGSTFSMSKKNGRKLHLHSGVNILTITPALETSLRPRPLTPHHISHTSFDPNWIGFVIGAPHGDCDWFTGEIATRLNQEISIPALTSYSCRFPYRGLWYDCNRPLMKLPKDKRGANGIQVQSQRVWNTKSERIYNGYQGALYKLSQSNSPRITFLLSLHGHDLTVRLSNNRTVSKNVIEGIGIGFSHQQLRKIKNFYHKKIKKYFPHPPPLYFGNLSEDQTFNVQGRKTYFTYSAVGTRLTGSLKVDSLRYGLHLETPNSLRVNLKDRVKFTHFLAELFPFIKKMIEKGDHQTQQQHTLTPVPPNKKRSVTIPSSTFLMGSNFKQDWSNEKPQHRVMVSQFDISPYEVTNSQFAHFLTRLFKKQGIYIQQGVVYSRQNKILARIYPQHTLSQIEFVEDQFVPRENRENYPAIHVSYYGAQTYARSMGAQLPTEAQWEKAASWNHKKETKSRYATKNTDSIHIEDHLPSYGNLDVMTRPVGESEPNSYGLYDMSGNVWEWTADWYADDTYRDKNHNSDPQGPEEGTMKTVRGGSWNLGLQNARTTMRIGVHPSYSSATIGFRVIFHNN